MNSSNSGKESMASVSLNDVAANVVKIHVDGVGRTKESLIMKTLASVFHVKHFEQLVLEAQEVKSKLLGLGCFSNIDIQIDTALNGGRSDYEITYKVKELKRFSGAINTLMGNQEGSIQVGLKSPNVLGQGERFQVDYSYGTKKTNQFNLGISKPLHEYSTRGSIPTLNLSGFQQMGQLPWSGYQELNRGLLLDLSFLSAPQVSHQLQYEASWRLLSCLDKSSAFAVREQCGHTLKSSLRHILSVDRRDNPVFPTEGSLFKLVQEYAGIGGDIGYFKNELDSQINVPLAGWNNVIMQGTFQCGHIKRMASGDSNKTMTIADRFFLGGPLNIRGFEMRGLGPNSEHCALGGLMYWAAGLHMYTPLPFANMTKAAGFLDLFRTHCFVNAGNLMSESDLFHSSRDLQTNIDAAVQNFRLTYGIGIGMKLGGIARIELNYCVPMRTQRGDRPAPGFQFGVGVDFL